MYSVRSASEMEGSKEKAGTADGDEDGESRERE